MEQSGEYRIAAAQEVVWQALNDPAVLAACINGCQSMERSGDNRFSAVVKARVGPVSATFSADLELTDIQVPERYTINAQVKGGAAGFGKGVAQVSLTPDAEDTVLAYAVHASVGGKLAQVGSRLIDGVAAKMARDFFSAFSERVSRPDEVPATDPTATDQSNGQWLIWGIAFAVLVLALVLAI